MDDEVEIPVFLQAGPGDRSLVGTVALKLLNVFVKKEIKKSIRQLAKTWKKNNCKTKPGCSVST